MEEKRKNANEKIDLFVSRYRRKLAEYSIVALVSVGVFASIRNSANTQLNGIYDVQHFNTVQNIDNNVFLDRVRKGNLKADIIATASDGCPLKIIINVPQNGSGFSDFQKGHLITETIKTEIACGQAIGNGNSRAIKPRIDPPTRQSIPLTGIKNIGIRSE